VLTAEGGPYADACDRCRERLQRAGRGTSGHRCVLSTVRSCWPSAPFAAQVQEPLTRILREQRHVVIGSWATAAGLESVIAIAPSAGPAKMPGQCSCWSLVSV
jgi:hypothetical protein